MFEQRTLSAKASLHGVGLHTGESVHVDLVPAEADTGVVFVRTDLPGEPPVEAIPENLVPRPRRTALVKGRTEVQTTEHLLAALFGSGIHNVEVRLDGPEVPGLDGSALPYYEAVKEAGISSQGCGAPEVRLRYPIAVTDRGASLIALGLEQGLRIGYTLDYGPTFRERVACPATQFLELEITEETFAREIAPARTFVFEEEIEALRAEGLGKGANTENTLVLGKDGVIDNELRFPDELVRHKILDLIGDLFLAGCRLHGHILATRSGHALNVRLARLIRENQMLERQAGDVRRWDDAAPANVRIEDVIPHRYPFLLLDRVLEVEGTLRAVGLKNLTANEQFCQGHFPGRPVMPGVLIVEAIAQLAGVLISRQTDQSLGRCAKRIAVLLSLDRVKFRKAVGPGDQLILEVKARSMKPRTARVEGTASVGGVVVAEAEMCFRVIDG
jgi:UDP-3-O-[3-hydroxymyristoyl] N-acetylglucosamine deacetylase/3-hydroxyacyl-[acyl-carrier-protein] dehydratase